MTISRSTYCILLASLSSAVQSYAFLAIFSVSKTRGPSSVAASFRRGSNSGPFNIGPKTERECSSHWHFVRQLKRRTNQREKKIAPAVNLSNCESLSLQRRRLFKTFQLALPVGLLGLSFNPTTAAAASSFDTSKAFPVPLDFSTATKKNDQVETGLLESRVTENLLSQPPYLLETSDVVYPSYFGGTWQVTSTLTDVVAPCGLSLFGGNATFTKAREDIGPQNALIYKARFVGGSGRSASAGNESGNDSISSFERNVIADRDYNVREIAKAAMGSMSVVDTPMATPNKFTIILAPSTFNTGSSSLIQVDMIALARRQENIINEDETKRANEDTTPSSLGNFHAAEVVRQIVSPLRSSSDPSSNSPGIKRAPPLIKEVETISLYSPTLSTQQMTSDGGCTINQVRCIQRSATYLVPRQDDPLAYKMWEASRGRPVDVRYYDVVYDRLK